MQTDLKYEIRELELTDYKKGYINVLSELTNTGNITEAQFTETFNQLKATKVYHIYVIYDLTNNIIIGTATLFIEKKFIHGCASKGHIEDVVISESVRGKNFGRLLVDRLIRLSMELGCYKTSLCCKEELKVFYEKYGLKCNGLEMAVYHNK